MIQTKVEFCRTETERTKRKGKRKKEKEEKIMEKTEALEQLRNGEPAVQSSDRIHNDLANEREILKLKQRKWWIWVSICIAMVLTGHCFVTLLLNFYYVQDGREDSDQDLQYSGTWMQALIQNAAFPILIPLILLIPSSPNSNLEISSSPNSKTPIFQVLLIYLSLGILVAAHSKLYALGKLYANFGIFTLIMTTQIIFTSVFAGFINRFRFNRWIIISIVLSIVAFIFGASDFGGSPDENEEFYDKAAWYSFFGNVAFSLSLCIIQLGFQKVIPKRNRSKNGYSTVLEMQICVSLIATLICVAGLFISGEFKELKRDSERFDKGKTYYVLSLVGLSLSWQVWSVGLMGLIFLVSCIFSNVVSFCVSPIASVLVVYAFRFMDDEFSWPKRGALLAALLGFASYIYFLIKLKRKEMVAVNQSENPTEV